MQPKDRIIVALDVPTGPEAALIMQELYGHVGMFKIGLELISSQEASFVLASARALGAKLFWDNKLCDIPNTVGRTTAAIVKQGVHMFNVHALAGEDAMYEAYKNKGDALFLAVTVLTSLDVPALERLGIGMPSAETNQYAVEDLVLSLARSAVKSGVDGLICSAKEVKMLKEANLKTHQLDPKKDPVFVTPGIRPEWYSKGDQKRVLSPKEAIETGADYLVVGRPITQPPDGMSRVEAANEIAQEIESAI